MTERITAAGIVRRILAAFAFVVFAALVAYSVLVPLVMGGDAAGRYDMLLGGLLGAVIVLVAFGIQTATWAPMIRRATAAHISQTLADPRDRHALYAAPRRGAALAGIVGAAALLLGYLPLGGGLDARRTTAAHLGAVSALLGALVIYAALRTALRPLVETLRTDRETDEDLAATVRPPIDRMAFRVAFAIGVPASAAALIGTLLVLANQHAVQFEQESAANDVINLALSVERRPGETESGLDGAVEALRSAGVTVTRGIRDWVVAPPEAASPAPAWMSIPIALIAALLAAAVGQRIGRSASRDVEDAARRMTVVGTSDIRTVTLRIARPRSIPEVRDMALALDALATTLIRMSEDQRRAVDVRAETAKLRSFVLASVSHDLRGPLNSVLGFADLLLSGVEGELSSGQQESLDALARGGRDLLRLVDDLLDHARIDAGRLDISRPLIEVDRVLELARTEALERARNAPGRGECSVDVEGESGLRAFADEERFAHALGALVAFALLRPGSDGRATMRVRREVSSVEFSIRGGGTTPSRDALQKLFDPFDFAPSGARAPAGLNLAVSVARGVVSLHRGGLQAHPDEQGGIRLDVVLPAPERPRTIPPGGMPQPRSERPSAPPQGR